MSEEKKKKNTKSSHADVSIRVLTVYNMILNGHQRPDIVRYASETWSVTSRTTDDYMAEANRWIESYVIEVKDKIMKKSASRLERLLAKTIAEGERTTALEIMKEYHKIFDIYPDPKMRHILDGKIQVEEKADLSKLTPEDLKALAEKLTETPKE